MLPPSSVLERTSSEVPGEFFGKGDVLLKTQTLIFFKDTPTNLSCSVMAVYFVSCPKTDSKGSWEHKKDPGIQWCQTRPGCFYLQIQHLLHNNLHQPDAAKIKQRHFTSETVFNIVKLLK